MSEPTALSDRFWTLLDAACAGELNDQEQAELQTLLAASPAARQVFLDHIGLCSQVRLWQRGQRSRQAGLAAIGLEGEPNDYPVIVDEPASLSPQLASFPADYGGWMLSYAAALVIMAIVILSVLPGVIEYFRQRGKTV